VTVVDSSVWVSVLVPADVHHAASRSWLEHHLANAGVLIAPVLLLAEIAGAISRRTGDAQLAHRAVRRISACPALRLVPVDARLGARSAQLAADLGLKGADAVFVATAHELSLPLISWDDEQRGRAATVIGTATPASRF
jgi:predicted nucleic acid-binding protein